jgi:hypothetical protein
MTIYNYIRPHWANGQKAVHDAPNWVVVTIEGMLADSKSVRKAGLVRIEVDYAVGLRIAWIQCPVALKVDGGIGAYRTALYVHAIARDVDDPELLTCDVARRLFEQVYGSPVETRIEEQQRYLEVLEHPEDLEVAASLFIGKEHLESVRAEIEASRDSKPDDRRAVPRRFGERGVSAKMSPAFSAEVDEALDRLRLQAWAGQRPKERPKQRANVQRPPVERSEQQPATPDRPSDKCAKSPWLHRHGSGLLMGAGFALATIVLGVAFLR